MCRHCVLKNFKYQHQHQHCKGLVRVNARLPALSDYRSHLVSLAALSSRQEDLFVKIKYFELNANSIEHTVTKIEDYFARFTILSSGENKI